MAEVVGGSRGPDLFPGALPQLAPVMSAHIAISLFAQSDG